MIETEVSYGSEPNVQGEGVIDWFVVIEKDYSPPCVYTWFAFCVYWSPSLEKGSFVLD